MSYDYQLRKDIDLLKYKVDELEKDSNSDIHEKVSELQTELTDNYYDQSQIDSQLTDLVSPSEWQEVTFNEDYSAYDEDNTLLYRQVGNIIELQGIWTVSSTQSASSEGVQFGSIPMEYAPTYPIHRRMQGEGLNTYLLSITQDGGLYWSNYGVTSSINLPQETECKVYINWIKEVN